MSTLNPIPEILKGSFRTIKGKGFPITKVIVIPQFSNLEQGVTEWMLTADGENTRLVYRMELTPKFWIPPLIGPPIIRYVLTKGGKDALQRLEAAARELDVAHSSSD